MILLAIFQKIIGMGIKRTFVVEKEFFERYSRLFDLYQEAIWNKYDHARSTLRKSLIDSIFYSREITNI